MMRRLLEKFRAIKAAEERTQRATLARQASTVMSPPEKKNQEGDENPESADHSK